MTNGGAVGRFPVRIPMIDVKTIGTGGGSIAWVDRAGALRDMIQNHLLQMLTLIAMEPPRTITERDLRSGLTALEVELARDREAVG